ncbi:MAG: AMP-binding protein [Bryobacterales bacterium]|nr:AMP-binding protein [Bryobacterales bacterium]
MNLYASRPWLQHYRTPYQLPLPQSTLADTLDQQAAQRPQAPALQYFDRTFSFAELDDLASRFAACLAHRGIGPGDRVALSLQNNPQFAIAQYGAWKRGAAIVPLSPMYKEEELLFQLQDSGAKAWVGLDSLFVAHARPALAKAGVEHIFTTNELEWVTAAASPLLAQSERLAVLEAADLVGELRRREPDVRDREQVGPRDLAHIVYTSGTTGKPKGAMGLHGQIAFNSTFYRTWMELGPEDAILAIAPLFHITGLVGHLGAALLSGVPLLLFHRFHPGEAVRMARQYGGTFSIASITAYLSLLNNAPAEPGPFLAKCFTGGAAVAPALPERFEATYGSYIHNTYGLTEVNSPSHSVPLGLRAPVDPASGALAIGVPIPNCEAQIVDVADPGRLLSVGEPGELVLKGPFVFEGYWNRAEATAAAFHEGWFLTGDVCVMDADGWFYIVDRKKDMINASGFKVWPREVEDVLYQHPAVKEAAVIGIPDDYRGESVKAFLAVRSDLTAEGILAFCRERLATYKVPREVEFVEEIPKTATGKFLRRALRTWKQPS